MTEESAPVPQTAFLWKADDETLLALLCIAAAPIVAKTPLPHSMHRRAVDLARKMLGEIKYGT